MEHAAKVGRVSLPTSERTTVIKPATKLPPEPPPRPGNRPSSVNVSSNLLKGSGVQASRNNRDILVVEAKPMDEVGFRGMKDSPAASGHPTTSNSPIVREESLTRDAERALDDNDSETLRKPVVPKPARPTIIRPHSRMNPPTDMMPGSEVITAPLESEKSSPVPASIPSIDSLPSPKPRSRDLSDVPSGAQKMGHFTAGKSGPPARPSSSPRLNLTSPGQETHKRLVEPQSPTKVSLGEASVVPNHNPPLPQTASATPKRPPIPPPSRFHVNKKGNTQLDLKTTEDCHLKSADVAKDEPDERGTILEQSQSSLNKRNLPKPKPKPRPASLKEDKPMDGVSKPSVHCNLPFQKVSHDTLPEATPVSGSTDVYIRTTVAEQSVPASNLTDLTKVCLPVTNKAATSPLFKDPENGGVTVTSPPKAVTRSQTEKIPQESIQKDNIGSLKCWPRDSLTETSISQNLSLPGDERKSPAVPLGAKNTKAITGPPPLPSRPGPGHPLYSYMSRLPHGIAVHSYTASQPDELSFSEGDLVILVKEVDEAWMIGQVGDQVGMYPTAFVEITQALESQSWRHSDNVDSATSHEASNDDALTGPRCRARFDFEGNSEGELTLQDGDVIQIVERVGTEWLRGQHRGRQGIFPSSFVEVIEDLPANICSQSVLPGCVTALFEFHGKDGELSFKTGDKISVISQVDSQWLVGTCNGQKGLFPLSFVSHNETDLSTQDGSNPQQEAEPETLKDKDTVMNEHFWESRETALGFCRAMFDYTDISPGDLKFRRGDRIQILEFIGEDWARGRIGNKEGIFPLRLVAEELNSPPSPEPEVVKVLGKVLHNFDGETSDDLVIKEGDIIEVEEFADINKHWRWGTFKGKRGMFPAEFVSIIG